MNKLKILFVISLLGIFLLLILQQSMPTQNKVIINSSPSKNLSQNQLGESIQIKGTIENVNYNKNTMTFYLTNYPYKIILFSNKPKIKERQEVEIYGKVELYKNNFEIIADKIYLIN
mgnify:FL=1|jgi:DNA/RNA endonuclease YhcR with UshA esterase domain